MMNLVVFTARFGPETDRVRPAANVNVNVRYLCFSDLPVEAPPYEWVPVSLVGDPRVAARRVKLLADHPLLAAADVTLWHDASYRLLINPVWVLRALHARDLVAMRHPRRIRIEDEAVAIARYGYLPLELALAHVQRYRACGFQANHVTCSGLLGRRVSPLMQRFNALWWAEALCWGGRDQASLDYAAWRNGVRLRYVRGTIRSNPYAAWRTAA